MWIFIRVSTNSYIKASARALGEANPWCAGWDSNPGNSHIKSVVPYQLGHRHIYPQIFITQPAEHCTNQPIGLSSLLDLVISTINITLKMIGFKTLYAQMVQVRGYDPLTPALSAQCSTNWAILAYKFYQVARWFSRKRPRHSYSDAGIIMRTYKGWDFRRNKCQRNRNVMFSYRSPYLSHLSA